MKLKSPVIEEPSTSSRMPVAVSEANGVVPLPIWPAANLIATSLLVPWIRSVSSIACVKLFTRTWTWPRGATPCAPGRPTSETRPRASSAYLPSAVRIRPTVALVIIRPRASGLSSPLASVIGPSPKNSVRPEPANVSTWVVPSLSVPDLKVPAPLMVTTPAMLSSRSETETENVLPSAAPKGTVERAAGDVDALVDGAAGRVHAEEDAAVDLDAAGGERGLAGEEARDALGLEDEDAVALLQRVLRTRP